MNAEFFFVERERAGVDYLNWCLAGSEWSAGRGEWLHLVNIEFDAALPGIIERIKRRGRTHRAIFLLDQ